MNVLYEVLGTPLGYIIWAIYHIVQNYGLAIIIFTVLLKICLVPLAIKQQKSSARMSAFQPYIKEINKKYAKNPKKKNEEIQKLYMEHQINPASGCLPMLIPMVILFGMIDVIYRPLTHILHLGSDILNQATEIFTSTTGNSAAMSVQLSIMKDVSADPSKYMSIGEDVVTSIQNINLNFLGLNLGDIADLTSITIIIPIAVLVFSFLQMFITMRTNTASADMPGGGSMKIMMFVMPIISVLITLSVPIGVSVYWLVGYMFGIIQVLVLNKLYNTQELREQAAAEFEEIRKKKKNKKVVKKIVTTDQNGKKTVNEEVVNLKQFERDRISKARKRLAEMYNEEYTDSEDIKKDKDNVKPSSSDDIKSKNEDASTDELKYEEDNQKNVK